MPLVALVPEWNVGLVVWLTVRRLFRLCLMQSRVIHTRMGCFLLLFIAEIEVERVKIGLTKSRMIELVVRSVRTNVLAQNGASAGAGGGAGVLSRRFRNVCKFLKKVVSHDCRTHEARQGSAAQSGAEQHRVAQECDMV